MRVVAVTNLCLLICTTLFAQPGKQADSAVDKPLSAKKKSKSVRGTSKQGVQKPGVQIPITDLEPDAEIALSGTPESMVFADSVYLASTSKDLIARLDPKTNKVSDAVSDLSQPCGGIINAFNSLWSPNCGDQTLTRLDAKTGKVTVKIPVNVAATSNALTASTDSIWLLSDNKTTLTRLDPADNKVVAESRLPAGCNSVLFGETTLWVTCPKEDQVLKVDPQTNLVVNRIKVAAQPNALAVGEGSIWVLCKTEGKVARINPKTNKVDTTIELNIPNSEGNIAFGEGSVWVSTPGFPISRISPVTNEVVQQFVGNGGRSIYAGLGSIWVLDDHRLVSRFDPNRIKATLAH